MMLMVRSPYFTAVFFARIVMPFSRSRSPESMIRSATPASSWCAVNAPAWWSIASTSVVLPWSTWATMATLRRLLRRVVGMAMSGMEKRAPLQGRKCRGGETRRVYGPVWSTAASSFTPQ